MRRRSGALLRVVAVAGLVAGVSGCEWFKTMSDPADIQPHEAAPWPPAAGSVPLDGGPEYTLATVNDVGLENPKAADSTSVAAGAEWYRNFCTVCHGPGGQGDGSISGIFPAIPPIDTPTVAGHSDAYLYGIITQGRGLMPEYSRIPPAARWDIVNFVRSLPTRTDATAAPAAAATPAAADTAAEAP